MRCNDCGRNHRNHNDWAECIRELKSRIIRLERAGQKYLDDTAYNRVLSSVRAEFESVLHENK